jgi:hypothetical protein
MYFTRPSSPISINYKQEGVRIRVNICTNRGEDGAVVGAAGQIRQGLETGAVTACHTGLNKRKVFNRKKRLSKRATIYFCIFFNNK